MLLAADGMTAQSIRQSIKDFGKAGTWKAMPGQMATDIRDIGAAGAAASGGELLGTALPATGKMIAKGAKAVGKTLLGNIPDDALVFIKAMQANGVDVLDQARFGTDQAVREVVGKIQPIFQALKRKLPQPPDPAQLYPIAQKARQAFESVRESISSQFGIAAKNASEVPARTGMSKAYNYLKSQIGNLLDRQGNRLPMKYGNRDFTMEEDALLNAYDSLRGASPHPSEGIVGASGTFMNYNRATRVIDRMQADIQRFAGTKVEPVLIRTSEILKKGLYDSDVGLAKVVPKYARFVGIREELERAISPALNTDDKAALLLKQSGQPLKAGVLDKLNQLDALAPKNLKFYDSLVKFHAQADVAKSALGAVKTLEDQVLSKGPVAQEAMALDYFNLPVVIRDALGTLEQQAGIPFVDSFKALSAANYFKSNPIRLSTSRAGMIQSIMSSASKPTYRWVGTTPWVQGVRRAGAAVLAPLADREMGSIYGAALRGLTDEGQEQN
jgi:hypothetical protein